MKLFRNLFILAIACLLIFLFTRCGGEITQENGLTQEVIDQQIKILKRNKSLLAIPVSQG